MSDDFYDGTAVVLLFVGMGMMIAGAAFVVMGSIQNSDEKATYIKETYPQYAELQMYGALEVLKHKDIDEYARAQIALEEITKKYNAWPALTMVFSGMGGLVIAGIMINRS